MNTNSITLSIDQTTCIQCGKCSKVCPAGILLQEKKGGPICVEHLQSCIQCGHCTDVCPTSSILHSAFPHEKIHAINYEMMPTPEQLMWLIKSRRSNRAITSTPVPREKLDLIVEAANYAPTATNAQSLSFTIITDPQKLKIVSDYTIGVFDRLERLLTNPVVKLFLQPFMKEVYAYVPAFKRMKKEHEEGKDPILRKATALLFIHTPKSNRFGSEDANLAYQNASLMAQSLNVSQIYMGFVLTAIRQDKKDTLSQLLGIDGKIKAIMALGMPAFRYENYTDRKPIRKKIIE